MALDYRQAGIDYREAVYSYQGSGDATVTPATIACTGNVEDALTLFGYRGEFPYRDTVRNYAGRGNAAVTPATIACVATLPEVQRSLPYQAAGVDYRQTATTYRGDNVSEVNIGADPAITTVIGVGALPAPVVVADANTAPGVIAGVGAVSAVSVASVVDVAAGVVAGVGAIPSVVVLLFTEALPAVAAGVGAVPAAVVTGNADVAPAAVPGIAAIPAATSIVGTANAAPNTVAGVVTEIGPSLQHRYQPTYQNTLPRLAKGEANYNPLAAMNQLARFYSVGSAGINVWIVSNASVSTTQPADETTITRTLYGAHESPTDLTSTEVALLITAGYGMDVQVAA
jgi:hypothetical protein